MVTPFDAAIATETLLPEPSDDPVNRWLDRVTRRLSVDRELQLEVRQELRSHLHDSMAEFRVAGRNASEARDEALRVLGDEEDLAEQLWQANRRRVRVRALGTWSIRLLVPAAVVGMVLFLSAGAWLVIALITPRLFDFNLEVPNGRSVQEHYRASIIANASPEVQLLFEQGGYQEPGARVAVARKLVDLAPNDPVLYANYATASYWQCAQIVSEQTAPDSEPLRSTLALLEDGERREPTNGLYPAMIASLLLSVSSHTEGDESATYIRPGFKEPQNWETLVVTDESRFKDGLAACTRVAPAPRFETYSIDLSIRKTAGMPRERIADLWLRAEAERDVIYRSFFAASCVYPLETYASSIARAGHPEEAQRVLQELDTIAAKVAAGARTDVEVQSAFWLRTSNGASEALVKLAQGDQAGADRTWAKVDALQHRLDPIRAQMRRAETQFDQAGLLLTGVMSEKFRYGDADPSLLRRAEYATADQLGVAVVACALLLGAAFYVLSAFLSWLRSRKTASPRLFIGWRRITRVLLFGAVVPVVFYLLYSMVTPLSGRESGLNATLGRVLVEYTILSMIVLALVPALSRRAVLARMRELQLPATDPRRSLPLWRRALSGSSLMLAGVCLVGVLVCAMGAQLFDSIPRHAQRSAAVPLLISAWALLLVALAAAVKRDAPANSPVLAGTFARATFPVLCIGALIVSLAGLPLRWIESQQVGSFVAKSGQLVGVNVVGETGYGALREELMRGD
jgi:hypothetical protein